MNLNDVTTQLLFTTVPIAMEKKGGGTATGTGFIYNYPVKDKTGQFIPLLVTNHHVIADSKSGAIEMIQKEKDKDLPSSTQRARIQLPGSDDIAWKNPTLDIAAIALGPVLNELEKAGRPAFFRALGPEIVPQVGVQESLNALEDIVFIGYPSGLRDTKNALPIIRRGITATPVWNQFEGTPTFLIDAGVFPGSSGSPVFLLNQGAYSTREGLTIGNRLLFLGVISQTFQTTDPGATKAFLGLGKVINASAVSAWIEQIVGQVKFSS